MHINKHHFYQKGNGRYNLKPHKLLELVLLLDLDQALEYRLLRFEIKQTRNLSPIVKDMAHVPNTCTYIG